MVATGQRKHCTADIARNFHLYGRHLPRSHSSRTDGSLQPTRPTSVIENLEIFSETLPQPIATTRHHISASSGPAFPGFDSRECGDRSGKASCPRCGKGARETPIDALEDTLEDELGGGIAGT